MTEHVAAATTQVKILGPGHQSMVALLGQRDAFLKLIEARLRRRRPRSGQRDHDHRARPTRPSASARIFEELLELLEQGHELTEDSVGQTIAMVTGGARTRRARSFRARREVLGDNLLSARGKKIAPKTFGQKRYVDAIRRSTITFAIGPAGHRQDLPRGRGRGAGAPGAAGLADHPHAARGRGGRAARVPARHALREDRPVHASALRRAVRDDRPRHAAAADGARDRRGRAARVHAGKNAERRVHHPGRGAEHHPRADEDVPHAAGVRLEGGRERRRDPGRPAERAALGPRTSSRRSSRASRGSRSSTSAARTWCATRSCRTSSRRTAATASSGSRPMTEPR